MGGPTHLILRTRCGHRHLQIAGHSRTSGNTLVANVFAGHRGFSQVCPDKGIEIFEGEADGSTVRSQPIAISLSSDVATVATARRGCCLHEAVRNQPAQQWSHGVDFLPNSGRDLVDVHGVDRR